MFKAFKEKRKKGFTLIELIVVIAVLGILVLLAAPRFLGYTADANVSAMQADAKVLQNSALVYNIENDNTWPQGDEAEALAAGHTATGITVYEIDEDNTAFTNTIQTLQGDYSDFVIAIDGENAGEVFHKDGVKDRNGDTHYGLGNEHVVEAE